MHHRHAVVAHNEKQSRDHGADSAAVQPFESVMLGEMSALGHSDISSSVALTGYFKFA